ncbi:enoyl-CoA hydratase [Mycobacterium sp. shizuoka-1]|uniref:enoyl-CoA hydratase n=1 Tax=Mycobacterium sp. shizuoka-1 TaxID=2039281 RepID=UPI000C062FDE|nr:enoyl-CoA hydratase [Mycobacterium sp. shizuoka-1]GAY15256.1 enoyl-CoA hydratase [Mycobacterium sp. shizuoka-1]
MILLSDDHGAVRVLTMNRPEVRNALSTELFEALFAALAGADADESVRAVVLTGTDPAFCAGVDLKQAQHLGMDYFGRFDKMNCMDAIVELRKPVVGAINGATFTGGLEIALACDFLIASERAVFADTHARVGILPGGGMTARLPRLVGSGMARRLSMTGEVVDARRAERIGLVTEVVSHDDLLPRALDLAGQIAEVPAATMTGLKEIYRSGTAAITGPALKAERAVSATRTVDTEQLAARQREVAQRNKRQIL